MLMLAGISFAACLGVDKSSTIVILFYICGSSNGLWEHDMSVE